MSKFSMGMRAALVSSPVAEGGKAKLAGKLADKEDKSYSLAHSTFPTSDNLPALLRALGSSGLRATVPFTSENEETATTGQKPLDGLSSLHAAYLHLRNFPEGYVPENELASEEAKQEQRAAVLALALAVLEFESEPQNYTPAKVPNTMAHALKLLAARREKEAKEAQERSRKASENAAHAANGVNSQGATVVANGAATNGTASNGRKGATARK